MAMDADTEDIVTGNNYDKYGSTNAIEQRIMAGFVRRLEAALPATPPRRILEVGIGEGEITQLVADRYDTTVVGIDLPDDELATGWTQRRVAASFADIARLPFPDDSFDLVLGIEVLEHVPDPEAALREIARVARRDVVVSVPREPIWRIANMARGKYLRDLGNTPGHLQHWSSRAFRNLIASYFEIVDVQRPFPWTMVQARVRD